MKKSILILLLIIKYNLVFSQISSNESYSVNTIAFYNVENLFDKRR